VTSDAFTLVDTVEYLKRTAGLLHDCFRDVVRAHHPEVEPVLGGGSIDAHAPPELLARAVQAQGMWFQLLSIAEQNTAMRQRRQSEVERGHDQLRGTFAHVVSTAAASGITADDMRAVVANLRVRPVITAHPTEAKRVTVLEKHRRIYRRLVDLEAPRWTPRERASLVENLRTEIDLLWLTGELRLEKPTVSQELAWGLYFVNENLFDVVQGICRRSGATTIEVAQNDEQRARIWKGRKAAFAAMGRVSPNYYVQDGVVPRTQLPQVLNRIRQLEARSGLRIGNVFHAGDGNLHPLICYDERVPGEADKAVDVAAEILSYCIEAGGSLTGEHGIGADKSAYMPQMFTPDDLALMQRVRAAFDPRHLCNPGKIFPAPRLCGEVPGPYRRHPAEEAGLAERL